MECLRNKSTRAVITCHFKKSIRDGQRMKEYFR